MFAVYVLFMLLGATAATNICNSTESGCVCKSLPYENAIPVKLADCAGKNIEDIPSLNDDINFLDLSLNDIATLDPRMHKLSSANLHVLMLKYNRIDRVDSEFFLTLPNLKELDLSHNRIGTIDSPQLFQNLEHLVRLDLSFNKLKQLPNGIFSPLTHIRFLFLGNNPMGDFLMGSRDVLHKELGVSSNLTHLHMESLGIAELHGGYFDEFKKMQSLSLADNNFTIIPNVPNTLEKLDLSGNKLTLVAAKYLHYPKLKVLKLNRMDSFSDVHPYAFYNLESLEKLFIEDCPNVKEFGYLAFDLPSKNTRLHPQHVSLARNGLTYLNASYSYFLKNMSFLDLSDNPWSCSCDILWLKDFEEILHKRHEIRCHSPVALRNKRMLDLGEQDLIECYPHIYGKQSHRVLIAVLSVSIVILIGLIFVLLRYPHSNLFPKAARVLGPLSPYSLASTSDSV